MVLWYEFYPYYFKDLKPFPENPLLPCSAQCLSLLCPKHCSLLTHLESAVGSQVPGLTLKLP